MRMRIVQITTMASTAKAVYTTGRRRRCRRCLETTMMLLLLFLCQAHGVLSNVFAQGSIRATSCEGNTCQIDIVDLASTSVLEVQLQPNATRRYFQLEQQPSSITGSSPLKSAAADPAIPNSGAAPEWYGEEVVAENGSFSTASVNLVQEGSVVFGSVIDGEDVYQIRTRSDGITESIVTASLDFAPEGHAVPLPNGTVIDDFDNQRRRSLNEQRTATTVSSKSYLRKRTKVDPATANQHRSLYDDLGGNLDIMVVWTQNAECMVAGKNQRGCTLDAYTKQSMVAMVHLAMEETNKAYELSGISTRLRLVHGYRHDSYQETSSYAFDNALQQVTFELEDVHEKRALYGADLVAMIIDDGSACGLAWEGPNKDYMFSITSWRCSTGHFSFGHEIGHNLGCKHDMGTHDSCDSSNANDNYSYGYRDPQGAFRSIMAYECRTGQCDNVQATIPCTRVQQFSNPNSLIDGKPIGHGAADNARTINEASQTVASYFPVATECISDAECQSIDPCMKCGTGGEWPGISVCLPDGCSGNPGGPVITPTPSPTAASSTTPKPTTPSTTPSPTITPSPTAAPSSTPSPSMSPSSFSTATSPPSLSPTTSSQPSSSLSPTSTPKPSAPPTVQYGCQDDPDWTYENPRSGTIHGCAWVSLEPHFNCRVVGEDGRSSLMACQASCNTCPT